MRTVPCLDLPADHPDLRDAIADLYAGHADLVALRGAVDPSRLAEALHRVETQAQDWARPNQSMPVEDVHLLGTDTPATPTFRDPRGATLQRYLDAAASHRSALRGLFDFDLQATLESLLARCAGGRPVRLARAQDGRAYAPMTLRRLAAGTQIGLHHDLHYGLELYRELAQTLDRSTLVSFVLTLQAPRQGGQLQVYAAHADDTDLPRLANGYAYDLAAVEQRYAKATLAPAAGDLFLLAAGRCLHRVQRVEGELARVTLGGFLALTRDQDAVLYWS